MCANIENHIKEKRPFSMFRAFRCGALDAIFSICFARSMNTLSSPGFRAPLERAVHAAVPPTMVFKHFPTIQALLGKVPPRLVGYLRPEMVGYLDMLEVRPVPLIFSTLRLIWSSCRR